MDHRVAQAVRFDYWNSAMKLETILSTFFPKKASTKLTHPCNGWLFNLLWDNFQGLCCYKPRHLLGRFWRSSKVTSQYPENSGQKKTYFFYTSSVIFLSSTLQRKKTKTTTKTFQNLFKSGNFWEHIISKAAALTGVAGGFPKPISVDTIKTKT